MSDQPKDIFDQEAAAFELSWERLEETAQQLGCLLSLFALAPIPWPLVEQVIQECNSQQPSANIFQRLIRYLPFLNKINHQPPSSLSQLGTTAILEEARATLQRLNLIQRSDQDTYQLQPLIREFFRDKGKESGEVEKMKRGLAAAMVAEAKQIPCPLTLELVGIFQPKIPHLQEVAKEMMEFVTDEDLIWPCIGLGGFYFGQGLYELAEPWFQQCKAVLETRLGKKHPDFATSLNNLALLYYSQERYDEVEELYLQVIAIDQQSLPESYSSLATSLNNLALLYYSLERYDEAEQFYLQVIAIDQQSPSENHRDLATHLNNLAELYHTQECYSKAEPLYEQAIEIAKHFPPEDHTLLAAYLNNLALLYQSQGRYSEAEPLYLEAWGIDYRALGSEHPDTVRQWDNLSDFLMEVVSEGQESVLSKRPSVQKLLTIIKEKGELDT